jgi:hypothetical protein
MWCLYLRFVDPYFFLLSLRLFLIGLVLETFVIFERLGRTDIDGHVNDSDSTLFIKQFECIFRVIFIVHNQKLELPQRLALLFPLNFNDIDHALI